MSGVRGPHTSWLATMKSDLSYHNLSVERVTELALVAGFAADHSARGSVALL